MQLQCFQCKKKFDMDDATVTVQRSEECPNCGAPVRCCYMCDFYDASSYNECREPMAEKIREKDKANFCNYYRLAKEGHKPGYDKDDYLKQADSLFKK